MSIFNRPTFQTYYQRIDRIVGDQSLDKETPDYLLQVDFETYLDYLVTQCEWQPLEWDESKMTIEPFSISIERQSQWDCGRTYREEVQMFRLRIPVSPHPQRSDYLNLLPSVMDLSGDREWDFKDDVLVVEVETNEGAVQRVLQDVRNSFSRRNKDIEDGNKTLRERIRPVWETRRTRLEDKHQASKKELEKLQITLYRENDPKAKPIEVKKRALRTVINKPTTQAKPESYLRREDVLDLVDFVEQYARQFEVTPRVYSKFEEEELRDLMIGMMNANYRGAVTAETFNKLGKTDICLRVDAGNVMICECKFWDGAKAYTQAIDQLFGYLTWRENYGVLIIFCKRKDMTAAIGQAKKAAEAHSSYAASTITVHSESKFSTRHSHPQDGCKSVETFHLFIDLSI